MSGSPRKAARRAAKTPNPNAIPKGTRPRNQPTFADIALIARLAERLKNGASWGVAFACEGLARNLHSMWRERASLPGAPTALVAALLELDKARGEAAYHCETKVHDGATGHLAWLAHQERGEWLPIQTSSRVEVSSDQPITADDIKAILGGIAGEAKDAVAAPAFPAEQQQSPD